MLERVCSYIYMYVYSQASSGFILDINNTHDSKMEMVSK